MAFEQKPNTGALFKNDSQHEKAPLYKGDAIIDGKKWQMSAWLNTSKKGMKYMSIKFEEPMGQSQGSSTANYDKERGYDQSPVSEPFDDVPF